MLHNKVDFRALAEKEDCLPIFLQPHWLDAVCQQYLEWQVAVSRDKNNQIIAVLVFFIKKKWGLTIITMPPLTKYAGIWFRHSLGSMSPKDAQAYEVAILNELINQIPKNHKLTLQLDYNTHNLSPFIWANYSVTVRFTQVLHLSNTIENLFDNLSTDVQRNIKKANRQFAISTSHDFETFLYMNNQVFERQNMKNPIPLSIWQSVNAILSEKQQRRIYLASDDKNQVHGSLYLIWDKKTAYILASGSSETGRKAGVMSQLIWKAIEDSVEKFETMDFLGSMLPPVQVFNQRFNTEKKAYPVITQYANRFIQVLFTLF